MKDGSKAIELILLYVFIFTSHTCTEHNTCFSRLHGELSVIIAIVVLRFFS